MTVTVRLSDDIENSTGCGRSVLAQKG